MSKSPSLRRIQADVRELAIDPSDRYHAAPLEDDMFEWHFTIRGAEGTEFEGGVYHGRILLPSEYPFKPPHIVFLTPSGRFETNTKVCLSFSAHHPELWQPAWGIRLILEALISFLPTPADGAIGALDWTKDERKRLAKKSLEYCCAKCGNAHALLPKLEEGKGKTSTVAPRFQKEIEKLRMLQIANEGGNKNGKDDKNGGEEKQHSREEKTKALTVSSPNILEEGKEITSKLTEEDPHRQYKTENAPEVIHQEEASKPPLPSSKPKSDGRRPVTDFSTVAAASAQSPTPPIGTAIPLQGETDGPLRQGSGIATEMQAADAPPQPAAEEEQAQDEEKETLLSTLSDPFVHGIIVSFAILCFLLYRKWMTLLKELDALEGIEGEEGGSSMT